jgi:hypothetical protein
VGIPVDELDCSRQLTHIFLVEHDRRIAQEFDEEDYVRWMDDQNIGVRNKAEGRRAVNVMTRSLAQHWLALNSGKTCFLTPQEVAVHFHLDANEALDQWWEQLEGDDWRMTQSRRQELSML